MRQHEISKLAFESQILINRVGFVDNEECVDTAVFNREDVLVQKMPELGAPNLPVALSVKGPDKGIVQNLNSASAGNFQQDRLCRIDGSLVLNEILKDVIRYGICQFDSRREACYPAVVLADEFHLSKKFSLGTTETIRKHFACSLIKVGIFEATIYSLVVSPHG